MDIVIPLGSKCGWGEYEELRYALRSAQQYVPDLRRVYVIGCKPNWLDPACHIGHPDPYKHNKDANLIQKVARACLIPGISKEFIRMSDDQLFLAPWKPHRYYLEELGPASFNRQPAKWYRRLRNTYKALQHLDGKIRNFDAHVPAIVNRDNFIQITSRYDYGYAPGMCINTLYMNHFGPGGEKLPEKARMGVATNVSRSWLDNTAEHALFANYIDKGLSLIFKNWLSDQFPIPSKFEVDSGN